MFKDRGQQSIRRLILSIVEYQSLRLCSGVLKIRHPAKQFLKLKCRGFKSSIAVGPRAFTSNGDDTSSASV